LLAQDEPEEMEQPHFQRRWFRGHHLKTEIVLAILPALMVIAVLMLLEAFSKQQLLFSSLTSSAFLIYLDPKHPTNSVRTLVIAQITAAVIGYLVILLLCPGYGPAALSMIVAIMVMILAKAMHPPAVTTSLIFAFQYNKPDTLMLFLLATVLLVLLIVLQRTSLWLMKRTKHKSSRS
jgi:CBS-domain-containing membrane protein